jgi:hypothetical protein
MDPDMNLTRVMGSVGDTLQIVDMDVHPDADGPPAARIKEMSFVEAPNSSVLPIGIFPIMH